MNANTMKAVREAVEAERKAWQASGMAGVPLKELRERMAETDRLLDTEASQPEALVKTTTTQLCAECFKPMESGNGANTCQACRQQDREGGKGERNYEAEYWKECLNTISADLKAILASNKDSK